ncbi:MAG TPA: hemerythrin domain-containing protein [bacterium]|nr:hemerythrin domain-containing protein [bacterium]HXK93997.1 hemerythrin domain-containing protein [bacterium]
MKTGTLVPAAAWAGWAASPWLAGAAEQESDVLGEQEKLISPAEDLMREHGVLNRVLLIYEEIIFRIRNNQDYPPEVLAKAAGLVRKFIEDYHEKLEEEHLFPRFDKANKLVDLVAVLRDQHKAGRVLTDFILTHASTVPKEAEERRALTSRLRLFIRMYRPHEAREDTVLFPALRSIVPPHEYGALGEEFEDKEHELFGEGGFEEVVASVAGLEKQLGIGDLAHYTPKE